MHKPIRFTKMHGLGNDFVVIDALHQAFDVSKIRINHLSDRHVGIGFDQLLLIEPSKQSDFFCRIFNSDGSEAEQCGNGLRCIARYIHEEKLHATSHVNIETKAGIFPIEIKDYDHIRVTMGAPTVKETLVQLALNEDAKVIPLSILSLGNPHAVTRVESIDSIIDDKLATNISSHVYFPHGVNVGFMQVINNKHIRLRTFERGAGETFACGSNACAAAVAGILNGWLQNAVEVEFRNGSLMIEWNGEGKPIHMTGPASRVFDGEIL